MNLTYKESLILEKLLSTRTGSFSREESTVAKKIFYQIECLKEIEVRRMREMGLRDGILL